MFLYLLLLGNWKEELAKVIEPDQLPVKYGGTRKDEDGDEYCSSLVSKFSL